MSTSNGADSQYVRFVTKEQFQSNLERQVLMSSETLAQLRKYEVLENTQLRLEYFFYTNTIENVQNLSRALEKKKYSVNHHQSLDDEALIVVTGWTTSITMDKERIVKWTREMTLLGYQFDCEFDGWGTNPYQ